MFFHISSLYCKSIIFPKSIVFPQIFVLPQNSAFPHIFPFIANSSQSLFAIAYVQRPMSLCLPPTWYCNRATTVRSTRHPMVYIISQSHISLAHFAIAHRYCLGLHPLPPPICNRRCDIAFAISQVIYIYKSLCPLAPCRCDIAICSQLLDLPSLDPMARIYSSLQWSLLPSNSSNFLCKVVFCLIKGKKAISSYSSFDACARSQCKESIVILHPFWPPPCRKAPDSELAASAQSPFYSPPSLWSPPPFLIMFWSVSAETLLKHAESSKKTISILFCE